MCLCTNQDGLCENGHYSTNCASKHRVRVHVPPPRERTIHTFESWDLKPARLPHYDNHDIDRETPVVGPCECELAAEAWRRYHEATRPQPAPPPASLPPVIMAMFAFLVLLAFLPATLWVLFHVSKL
jgi:hypothetical protein